MEKLAESHLNYDQVTFLADRICGICGYAHNVAYSSSIERALEIDVPLRAQYIRTILLEVERLHSHLLNLGLACHFVGFDTGFMNFFRVREKAMKMAEMLTGSRKTYGVNLIGGVRRDILKEQRTLITQVLGESKRPTSYSALRISGAWSLRWRVISARSGRPCAAPALPGIFVSFIHMRLTTGYPGTWFQRMAVTFSRGR
jgi:Ni,Fe-hydrogenase III large subunit